MRRRNLLKLAALTVVPITLYKGRAVGKSTDLGALAEELGWGGHFTRRTDGMHFSLFNGTMGTYRGETKFYTEEHHGDLSNRAR